MMQWILKKLNKNAVNFAIQSVVIDKKPCILECVSVIPTDKPLSLNAIPKNVIAIELSFDKKYFCFLVKKSITEITNY